MNGEQPHNVGEQGYVPPPLVGSLSAKLLALTIAFVMLAELLIYAPSLANFRVDWLTDRVAAGHLAILVLEATPESLVSDAMKGDLLDQADAYAVALRRPDRRLLLYIDRPPDIEVTVDLRGQSLAQEIRAAFATLLHRQNRVMRVLGPSPKSPDLTIEMVLDEADLRREMMSYSRNILVLSLFISLLTAGLLYLTLQWLMVRPMRRIAEGITEFAHNPEDATGGLKPIDRSDEIGVINTVLVHMQGGLRSALRQRERLAELGSAVSKINHDLRGILSTAVLISDRLAQLPDPQVQRIAPTLVQAIDRAINLCTQTLNYAREEGPQLTQTRFRLGDLISEVSGDLSLLESAGTLDSKIDAGLVVEADRDQLYRAFANIIRNAYDAGARGVRIVATADAGATVIDITDDGPGMSRQATDRLFQPFSGSSRKGGTGLGLVIARDVMRAHGGDVELLSTSAEGTVFRLRLPAVS
ncbi:MAG: sensor histidine kinase [Alphaproteobacteria bacterium]